MTKNILVCIFSVHSAVVSGLMFYHGFFVFLFVSYPPSSLNGTQIKPAHAWKWVRFKNACPKSGAYPPPTNRGPKHLFRRLRNLTANLIAYIFGIKQDIHNRASSLTTTRGILYHCKMAWTLVYTRLQIGPAFYPPYVNSAFYLIARLRRRRSAIGTQPNFAKRWIVNRASNLP